MKAINITAYTEDSSQIEAIKAMIKAFKIKYTISEANEQTHSAQKKHKAIKEGLKAHNLALLAEKLG